MKTKTMLVLAACLLILSLTSCDADGNTGNGANDPTAQFESDKTMRKGGSSGMNDTTNTSQSNPTSTDTSSKQGN